MKALRPIGNAEFVLLPRQLPPIKELEVRIDSSLRAAAGQVRDYQNCHVVGGPGLRKPGLPAAAVRPLDTPCHLRCIAQLF